MHKLHLHLSIGELLLVICHFDSFSSKLQMLLSTQLSLTGCYRQDGNAEKFTEANITQEVQYLHFY